MDGKLRKVFGLFFFFFFLDGLFFHMKALLFYFHFYVSVFRVSLRERKREERGTPLSPLSLPLPPYDT